MIQMSRVSLWTDACASCSCGGRVLVIHEMRNEMDRRRLPVIVVICVARCRRCTSTLRVRLKPIETPTQRMERLRREVSA